MILFFTDPWETLDHDKDTTLRLISELSALRGSVYWTSLDLFFKKYHRPSEMNSRRIPQTHTVATISKVPKKGRNGFVWKQKFRHIQINPNSITQVHYRLDPPLNDQYREGLQNLILFLQGRTDKIVNSPLVLLNKSEKLIPLELTPPRSLQKRVNPRFILSKRVEELLSFLRFHKKAVYKPLFGAQSIGVEVLHFSDSKKSGQKQALRKRLLSLTENESKLILIQEFLPEIFKGEIRLWFIDAKYLASVRKIPQSVKKKESIKSTPVSKKKQINPIINMDQGATLGLVSGAEIRKLSPVIKLVQQWLKKERIRLAAVDVIGRYITDFNVTSPGLIVQMEALLGKNLAKAIAICLIKAKIF